MLKQISYWLIKLFLRVSLIIVLVVIGSYFLLPKQHIQDLRIVHAVAQQLTAKGWSIPMLVTLNPLEINQYDCRPQHDFRRFQSQPATANSWSLDIEIRNASASASLPVSKKDIRKPLDLILADIRSWAPGLTPQAIGFTMDVYPNEREMWQELLAQKSSMIDVGGLYDSMKNAIIINAENKPKHVLRIVQHEGTHALIQHIWGETPSWFNEGLASYYENALIQKKRLTIKQDQDYLARLTPLAKQKRLLSLHDFLNPNVDYWRNPSMDREQLTILYAISWSLIQYMSEETPDLLAQYTQKLSSNTCQFVDDIAFFNEFYPGGLISFEQKWLKWIISKSKRVERQQGQDKLKKLGFSEEEIREINCLADGDC